MITLILIIICGFIYYLFNEFEDESIKNNWKTCQHILNSGLTWKNKYLLDENQDLIPYVKKWYHFGIYPKYEERFIYSTTIFVMFTDAEHFFQGIKNLAIYIGLLLIGFKYFLMFFIGKSIASFIKEKFLRKILN
jgi:hypothetical protein